jgi:hypothetical protein
MTVFIDALGIKNYERFLETFPEITPRAASMALNQTAERKGLKLAREKMVQQVAFPTGYLYPPRFEVKKPLATPGRLLVIIRGAFTPTPLARFAGTQRARFVTARKHNRTVQRPTIKVQIKPGRIVELPRAFLLTLRNGNIGLGIRLKPGEVLSNTVGAKMITTGPLAGVALLYGPSVDQVFRSVAVDITPELLIDLESEFLRQWIRMTGNA